MHISPDVGMGVFQTAAAVLNARTCIRLYRDKHVAGISATTVGFYTVANFYNLYFWSALGQWFAVFPGVPMASLNLLWVCMAFHYRHRSAA
jgi:hypothetical protein